MCSSEPSAAKHMLWHGEALVRKPKTASPKPFRQIHTLHLSEGSYLLATAVISWSTPWQGLLPYGLSSLECLGWIPLLPGGTQGAASMGRSPGSQLPGEPGSEERPNLDTRTNLLPGCCYRGTLVQISPHLSHSWLVFQPVGHSLPGVVTLCFDFYCFPVLKKDSQVTGQRPLRHGACASSPCAGAPWTQAYPVWSLRPHTAYCSWKRGWDLEWAELTPHHIKLQESDRKYGFFCLVRLRF